MQIEENAGLGFGRFSLAGGQHRRCDFYARGRISGGRFIRGWHVCGGHRSFRCWCCWRNPISIRWRRLLTPYYAALLLPPLLVLAGHETVVEQNAGGGWRVGLGLRHGGGLAGGSRRRDHRFRCRPFWRKCKSPGRGACKPSIQFTASATTPSRPSEPRCHRNVKILGLVTFDDPETSLWRPFGSRRDRTCYVLRMGRRI